MPCIYILVCVCAFSWSSRWEGNSCTFLACYRDDSGREGENWINVAAADWVLRFWTVKCSYTTNTTYPFKFPEIYFLLFLVLLISASGENILAWQHSSAVWEIRSYCRRCLTTLLQAGVQCGVWASTCIKQHENTKARKWNWVHAVLPKGQRKQTQAVVFIFSNCKY